MRFFYFLHFSLLTQLGENIKNTNKNNKINISHLKIIGSYTENSSDFKNLILIKPNEFGYLGIIKNIKWTCPRISLEDLQKYFPNFCKGKSINPIDLRLILYFLKERLELNYEFKIRYKKGKPQEGEVILNEKKNIKYNVKKIKIKGNNLLTEEEILEAINPVISETSLIEKLKFLISKTSSSIVGLENLENSMDFLLKQLGQKKLLLDLNAKIIFIKDEKNKTLEVILEIEEGPKYFVRSLNIKKKMPNKKIIEKKIKHWIEKYGMENGSFSKNEERLEEEGFFYINIKHKLEEGVFLDIYVNEKKEKSSVPVNMIWYSGLDFVSFEYLSKHIPIQIGDYFNLAEVRKSIKQESAIFGGEIKFDTTQTLDKKLNIYLNFEPQKNEQKILNVDNNFFPSFQYSFFLKNYKNPRLQALICPKIKTSLSSSFHPGLSSEVSYQDYKKKLNFFSGEVFFNIFDNQNLSSQKKIIRSLNFFFFFYKNSLKPNFSWSISPLAIKKYFNQLTPFKDIEEYIYVYCISSFKKKFFIKEKKSLGSTKGNIFGQFFIFYENFGLKFYLNPEFLISLTKKIELYISLKGVVTNSPTDINNKNIFLHFSMINAKDQMNGLLWGTHLLKEEYQNYPLNIQSYLFNKNVYLSNLVFNGKIMLNYILFKGKFPGIGSLKLAIFIFFNSVSDFTNSSNKQSTGVGLLGVYNKNSITISLGKKFTKKGLVNKQDVDYGLSFDHCSF